jgi:hypothetical protein
VSSLGIHAEIYSRGRSQWPSSLRQVLSSAARTLGSWVWISLEAWMYVRVFLCCVVPFVGRGLASGWSPVLPTVQRIHKFQKINSEPEQGKRPNPWKDDDDYGLFMRLEILLKSYIFTLMNFVVNNGELFQIYTAIHSVNTRNRNHLHRPTANPSCFQKSAYYAGIKIFNSLLSNLRSITNKKARFKVSLKRYLNTYSFTVLRNS